MDKDTITLGFSGHMSMSVYNWKNASAEVRYCPREGYIVIDSSVLPNDTSIEVPITEYYKFSYNLKRFAATKIEAIVGYKLIDAGTGGSEAKGFF